MRPRPRCPKTPRDQQLCSMYIVLVCSTFSPNNHAPKRTRVEQKTLNSHGRGIILRVFCSSGRPSCCSIVQSSIRLFLLSIIHLLLTLSLSLRSALCCVHRAGKVDVEKRNNRRPIKQIQWLAVLTIKGCCCCCSGCCCRNWRGEKGKRKKHSVRRSVRVYLRKALKARGWKLFSISGSPS